MTFRFGAQVVQLISYEIYLLTKAIGVSPPGLRKPMLPREVFTRSTGKRFELIFGETFAGKKKLCEWRRSRLLLWQ